MGDYIADRITTTSRFQEVKISDFPTITICMDPPQKSAIAKSFGFKSLQDIHIKEVANHTVRNLHFLSKNSTLISRENCRFFGVKNS